MLFIKKCSCLFIVILSLLSSRGHAQNYFTNPLFTSGADPWMIEKRGNYYYTHTTGKDLVLYKATTVAGLKKAVPKTVWQPPKGSLYSKEIWAPELHFIDDKWWFYFAADDGSNTHHRIYVLENASADPMKGTWKMKGKIADSTDKWAIDASVFNYAGKWYIIWSGWEGDSNGRQDIYIARMKNPWTIESRRVRISSPLLAWEKYGDLNDPNNPPHVDVNEGPEVLQHGKQLFIVYSASGCWTDHYGLGLLTFTGTNDLLDSASWQKSSEPVFTTSVTNGVFAPGHNSFFKSPDGKEDWILYHANSHASEGCGSRRSPRAQRFTWNKDGTPNFGTPVKEGAKLKVPSR